MRVERIVSVPRVRRRSTGERLREAVEKLAGSEARITIHTEAPWASITFAGTRHLFWNRIHLWARALAETR